MYDSHMDALIWGLGAAPYLWRLWMDRRGAVADLTAALVLSSLRHGKSFDGERPASARNYPAVAIISAVGGGIILLMYLYPLLRKGEGSVEGRPFGQSKGQPARKPVFFPCRTSHTRMFPQKHAFSYSYFYVGIPVGWRGNIGSLMSVDIRAGRQEAPHEWERKAGWFSVDAEDYLDRGGSSLGLDGKLDAYLRSQGTALSNYGSAYFVTAPRFLGHQFNPVSFWYLYSHDTRLQAMILEVNNTFDERRLYFLPYNDGVSEDNDSISAGEADVPILDHSTFRHSWTKDFHVSPFNSRKGSYSLTAHDPLIASSQKLPVDNRIILKSNKGSVKLVTRVFSTEPAVAIESMSSWQICRFIAVWCWVGFMTFPRILAEAWKLFFKRKLHVWFRPEVSRESIGRQHTSEERVIEAWFRRYLADCVKDMVSPCEVTFAPAGRPNLGREIFYSNLASHEPSDKTEKLEIRIRSPEFYNRLAHYAHTIEAFTTELLHTEELSKTVSVSKPSLLPALFAVHDRELKHPLSSVLETWHWYLVRCMRVVPPATSNATSDNIEETLSSSKEDIRSLPLSDLDRYVARVASCTETADYRRAVKKLFLSERVAFGLSILLTLYDVVARGALMYWAVRVAASVLADPGGAGRSRDLLTVLFKVCLLNGVNFWALGKSLLLE